MGLSQIYILFRPVKRICGHYHISLSSFYNNLKHYGKFRMRYFNTISIRHTTKYFLVSFTQFFPNQLWLYREMLFLDFLKSKVSSTNLKVDYIVRYQLYRNFLMFLLTNVLLLTVRGYKFETLNKEDTKLWSFIKSAFGAFNELII